MKDHPEGAPSGPLSFEPWRNEVERLCPIHLYCSWWDLCGDEGPLIDGFNAGLSPLAFVRWWAEKYDLDWRESNG